MGKLFEKDKDFPNATIMFQKAVEVNGASQWAHFRLGWIYIRNGDRDMGVDHLRKALNLNPMNIDVLTKLGEVLIRDQDTFDEAEEYVRRALEINENVPDALVSMGRIYEKKGELDEAVKCYDKALKQPVTNINAYYHLGVIHEKRKDYKKSI